MGLPVETVPAINTATAKGIPSQEAGKVADYGWSQTDTGMHPVPSKDVKERVEDILPAEFMWGLRNYARHYMGLGRTPSRKYLKPGHYWKWNPVWAEYQQRKIPSSVKKFAKWIGRRKR